MPHYHRLIIYFDGASRHNPQGPAGCGWAIYEMNYHGADGIRIASGNSYLGYNISNNQAEYEGLEGALTYMIDNNIRCHGLYIRGDSQIVINQLDGCYQVRSGNITEYYNTVVYKIRQIDKHFVKYTHIDRSRNTEADELANNAIDNHRPQYYSSSSSSSDSSDYYY
jgi:ribonuclease HI